MTVIGVLVAYDAIHLLTDAIRSAVEAGVDQIVVWDNSATNSAKSVASGFRVGLVTVWWTGENLGFGAGVNRAVRRADVKDGDRLLLLNPDAQVDATCLARLQVALSEAPGVVAPRMRYPDGHFGIAGGPRPTLMKETLAHWRVDDLVPRRLAVPLMRLFVNSGSVSYSATLEPGDPVRVDWVSGFCMLVDYEAFREIGGFDECYFLYFEDVDLCLRLRGRGYNVTLVRSAVATHWESATMVGSNKSSHYSAGRRRFFTSHGSAFDRAACRVVFR